MFNVSRILCLPVLIVSCFTVVVAAPPDATPRASDANHKLLTYKTTPQGELKIELFFPSDWKATDKRPAIVFFFGGGWTHGDRKQFVPQCEYLAKRGMVAATADYRIKSKHNTSPDKCVEDAKSAVRWMRQHAGELGIDPDRLAAGGGSAGGHLAAATAMVSSFDPPGEDTAVSSVPNALVLFNPALNLGGAAMRYMPGSGEAQAKFAHDFSPNNFITKKAPPAIIFFGTDDGLGVGGQEYLDKSSEAGNRAELYLAQGMKHGFFNKSPWMESTLRQADVFLASLGYVQGNPTIEIDVKAPLKRGEAHKNTATASEK
jgi:acetyl esterase/lipase